MSQLSASSVTSPVSVKSLGSCSQLIVTSAGTVNVGGVVSTTLMIKVLVVVFPHSSVAVQVLSTLNSFSQAPGVVVSSKLIVALPHSSVAVKSSAGCNSSHSIVISSEIVTAFV